jgi:hypothetical protein
MTTRSCSPPRKRWVLFLAPLAALALTAFAWAELKIASLDKAGNLVWTNSVSKAAYRVEWASSAQGPWRGMETLTNLSAVAASNSTVTVQVPMFYRVVWVDSPAYVGCYSYSGYDEGGSLVVTGRLCLSVITDAMTHTGGTWKFDLAGDTSERLGPQIGSGSLEGQSTGNRIWLNLNPGWADNNVFLLGDYKDGTYKGAWDYSGIMGTISKGTFTAVKDSP